MHGLSYANEDCAVWENIKEIVACVHVIFALDCAVEAGKQWRRFEASDLS